MILFPLKPRTEPMTPAHERSLLDALANWREFRALVVGDFMLDELVYGDAERLAPDAPVPVLAVKRTERRAGGAANVCLDLVAMRAKVDAFGLVGRDGEGAAIREALQGEGVSVGGIVDASDRPTTLKQSVIGLAQHRHPQKMFRVDRESCGPIAAADAQAMLERFRRALPGADVVLLEDYNKGVCSPEVCRAVIDAARAAGVPTLVDPAAISDYARYARATCVTPNRSEAEKAGGAPAQTPDVVKSWGPVGARLIDAHQFEAVVLTLDREGALLAQAGGRAAHVPTVARQVYDVTGAGDMVLAALAAGRANGMGWEDATRFANVAAGLEVEVFGVQPIPLERIHKSALSLYGQVRGKERTLEEAMIEVGALRREGKRVVFTNGCFDLLHAGHIGLLRFARAQGDALVVGLNSDDSVRRLKGPERPVQNEHDRADILSELESVSMVVVFDDDTPMRLIETLRPDVLVKGGDYAQDQVVGGEFVRASGGAVVLAPLTQGRSTTSVVERIKGRAD